MRIFAAACLFSFALSGCGFFGYVKPTETDRQLNRQNVQIGENLERVGDPDIVQAGKDVKANSITLESNVLGKPETPIIPYNPMNSERLRQKSTEEHATPWWKLTLGGIGTFLVGLVTSGALIRVFPTVFGGPVGAGLTAIVEAIAKSRAKAEPPLVPGAPVPEISMRQGAILDVIGTIKKELELAGAQKYVQKLTEKIEDKLGLDIKTKLPVV